MVILLEQQTLEALRKLLMMQKSIWWYANVETSFGELVEYNVTATNLDKPSEEASDLPFGDATDPFA